jgi:diketogulonate reductase-like aldo/keto reductase
MKTVQLANGDAMPVLGIGTWRMGESARNRPIESAAVREALQLGYRLVDTAEMYGEGGAESLVGETLRSAFAAGEVSRKQLFIVSKVYPQNASRRAVVAACERSLKRLQMDCIDLYLLHWRGPHSLAETVEAFESLKAAGRIRNWGVSNFDVDDLEELWAVPDGTRCATDQVWYSVGQRGPEFALLPWLRPHAVSLMAYSPIDQAALARHRALAEVGRRLGATAAQVALAWLFRRPGVVAIPKAVRSAHLRENLAAAELQLDDEALAAIDAAFPPPRVATPLAIN